MTDTPPAPRTSTDKLGELLPVVLAGVPSALTGPLEMAAPVWAFLEPQAHQIAGAWLAERTPEELDAILAGIITFLASLRSDGAAPPELAPETPAALPA